MRRRRALIAGLLSAAAIAACSPQQPAQSDPADVIRPLYERYRTDPAATTFPTLTEQAPWSAAMRAALEAMMAHSQERDEPILDFDPFVNAQDWEIQNVEVRTDGVVANSHATVRATITNAGFSEDILFDLVSEGGGWRVDNIRNSEWDLRQIAAG